MGNRWVEGLEKGGRMGKRKRQESEAKGELDGILDIKKHLDVDIKWTIIYFGCGV